MVQSPVREGMPEMILMFEASVEGQAMNPVVPTMTILCFNPMILLSKEPRL